MSLPAAEPVGDVDGPHLPPGVPPLRLLGKVVRVMEALTGERSSLSMVEIIERTGLPTTTAGRIVHNLVALNILAPDGHRFRVGFTTLAWAAGALKGKGLVEHGRDVLRRLRDATGETAFLVVRTGTDRMCLAVEEPSSPIRHSLELGDRVPLHTGSTGWVFLAFDGQFADLTLARMREYWPRARPGELRPVLAEVRAAREAGYAVSVNSSHIGATGISAPVFDAATELAKRLQLVARRG